MAAGLHFDHVCNIDCAFQSRLTLVNVPFLLQIRKQLTGHITAFITALNALVAPATDSARHGQRQKALSTWSDLLKTLDVELVVCLAARGGKQVRNTECVLDVHLQALWVLKTQWHSGMGGAHACWNAQQLCA